MQETTYERPWVCVCYPGHEIPKWFMYQTIGPLLDIKLPPYCFDANNFLGFALCTVVTFDDNDENSYKSDSKCYFECETHFKTRLPYLGLV